MYGTMEKTGLYIAEPLYAENPTSMRNIVAIASNSRERRWNSVSLPRSHLWCNLQLLNNLTAATNHLPNVCTRIRALRDYISSM